MPELNFEKADGLGISFKFLTQALSSDILTQPQNLESIIGKVIPLLPLLHTNQHC